MTEEFVYLRTGEKCRVLRRDEDWVFVAVQIVCEYYWGDEEQMSQQDGAIMMVPSLHCFEEPPTKVLSEEVKKLSKRIIALSTAKMGFEREICKVKQRYEEKLAEYARLSDVLARLDLFLCGGITHYFIREKYYKPEILTVEETISSDTWRHKRGRLLILHPEKKSGALIWSLNQYSDGSGSDWECVPCTSYEETLALGQKWVDEQAAEGVYRMKVVEFARKYELELPEGYISALIEKERRDLEKQERKDNRARREARNKKEDYWMVLKDE